MDIFFGSVQFDYEGIASPITICGRMGFLNKGGMPMEW